MGTRWGLMLPLVHHQCCRRSDVSGSSSVQNQVFCGDGQGLRRGGEGTDSRGGVAAGYFGNARPHALARTEREGGQVMSWGNCGENPARLPAFMLNAFSVTGP